MKVSYVCFALAILFSSSICRFSEAQESESDRKLAEMQTTIEGLKAELESLKNRTESTLEATTDQTPNQTWQSDNTQPFDARNNRAFTESYRRQPRPSPPRQTNYGHEFSRPDVPTSPYPGHPPTVVERVIVHQAAPVYVEPAYFQHHFNRRYGSHSRFGGAPIGGAYVGPNGWGIGIGGLQLNFGGQGYHRNGGHHGHHGHNKHHDD